MLDNFLVVGVFVHINRTLEWGHLAQLKIAENFSFPVAIYRHIFQYILYVAKVFSAGKSFFGSERLDNLKIIKKTLESQTAPRGRSASVRVNMRNTFKSNF